MKLDALFNAVMLELAMASHVPAASSDGDKVSHGKNSAVAPPRTSSPVAAFRKRWARCWNDGQRRQVITDAIGELRSLRYAKRLKGHESRELRIEIGLDPRGATVVAGVYEVSRQHVYNCRKEASQFRGVAGGIARSVRREGKIVN